MATGVHPLEKQNKQDAYKRAHGLALRQSGVSRDLLAAAREYNSQDLFRVDRLEDLKTFFKIGQERYKLKDEDIAKASAVSDQLKLQPEPGYARIRMTENGPVVDSTTNDPYAEAPTPVMQSPTPIPEKEKVAMVAPETQTE